MSTKPTEEEKPMSLQAEEWRSEISRIRGKIADFRHKNPGWKERVSHVEGALTCCLVTLAYTKDEFVKYEIARDDEARGPHVDFRSRGIGLDVVPCCFVCGSKVRNPDANYYLHNISAFVSSREDGDKIIEWFGCKNARLDFRPSEPGWIQVKVGACDEHLPNLRELDRITSLHGVIRERDIAEARELQLATA